MNIYDIIIVSLLMLFMFSLIPFVVYDDEIYEKYALKKLKKRTLRPETAYIAFYDELLHTRLYQTLTANDLQYLLQKIYFYLLKEHNAEADAEATKIAANAEAEANKKISDSITDKIINNKLAEARIKHGWITVSGSDTVVTNNK